MRLVFISSVTASTPLRTISVTTGSALRGRSFWVAFLIVPRRRCSQRRGDIVYRNVPRKAGYDLRPGIRLCTRPAKLTRGCGGLPSNDPNNVTERTHDNNAD